MIDLKYSLVIEATEDPTFFGFYSPELEGFTGIGHSIEDCLYKAKWGNGGTSRLDERTKPSRSQAESESHCRRAKRSTSCLSGVVT